MKTQNLKTRMWCGTCLTSKLYDEIIKMSSKSHETIPFNPLANHFAGAQSVITQLAD
jgi:hypothetical protein